MFLFLGIFSMWIIQSTRTNKDIDYSYPILIISDLTIPSRQTYIALEYVDKHQLTFGKSMSMGVIGLAPFLPSILTSGKENEFSTGILLTRYTLDNLRSNSNIGLGSTIIADVYLSFGLLGVFLFMFLLGYFLNKLLINSLNYRYYSLIALSAMLANCVFVVRDSYTYPLRYVVWSLIIAYANKVFVSRGNCKPLKFEVCLDNQRDMIP